MEEFGGQDLLRLLGAGDCEVRGAQWRQQVAQVLSELREELDLRELSKVPLFMVTGESGWRGMAMS